MPFHPYLMFGGNCREAFTRYHEIFGGELEMMSYSDVPSDGDASADMAQMGDYLAHASLSFDGHLLMASDDPSPDFGPVKGMEVMYSTDDPVEAKRVFDALVDGGKEMMPFGEQFWSPAFGSCIDRFGTPWMVSTDPPAES